MKTVRSVIALAGVLGIVATAGDASAQQRSDRVGVDVWVVTKDGKGVGYQLDEGTMAQLSTKRDSKPHRDAIQKKFGGDRVDMLHVSPDWCGVLWTDEKGRYRIDSAPNKRKATSDIVPVVERQKGTVVTTVCATVQPDAKRDPDLPRKCMVERFADKDLEAMYPPGSSFTFFYYLVGWYKEADGHITAGAVSPLLVASGTLPSYGQIKGIGGSLDDHGRKELDALVMKQRPELRPGVRLTALEPHARGYHWDRACAEQARQADLAHITWSDRKYPPLSKKEVTVVKTDGYAYSEEEPVTKFKFGVATPQ